MLLRWQRRYVFADGADGHTLGLQCGTGSDRNPPLCATRNPILTRQKRRASFLALHFGVHISNDILFSARYSVALYLRLGPLPIVKTSAPAAQRFGAFVYVRVLPDSAPETGGVCCF